MALLFYTTECKPERAQAEIQKMPRSMGARRITLEYEGPHTPIPAGMGFTLETPQGEREFLLPARVDRVLDTLKRQSVLRGAGQRSDPIVQREHAAAVAWRTLLEWVKVQAALAETNQATVDEIMLPYMLLAGDRPGQHVTLYEQFSADRALPAGS
jgi:hypothetical protein